MITQKYILNIKFLPDSMLHKPQDTHYIRFTVAPKTATTQKSRDSYTPKNSCDWYSAREMNPKETSLVLTSLSF